MAEKIEPTGICRTCLEDITFEEREARDGSLVEAWYDAAPVDPGVCYSSRNYDHKPMEPMEKRYFLAGGRKALADAANDYGPGQVTFMGTPQGYVKEWLRQRAAKWVAR